MRFFGVWSAGWLCRVCLIDPRATHLERVGVPRRVGRALSQHRF